MIRTLGRAGVPVYAVTEEGVTPASTSRYLTGQVKLSSGGEPDQAALLDRLVELVDRLPAKPLLVCTDDEAAVLVAEGAGLLAGRAICPAVPPDLPRQLASKPRLHEICRRLGVPTPATSSVRTGDELVATLANLALPVVVKQADSWSRLSRPVVPGSTVVRTAEEVRELRAAFDRWPEGSDVIVQEYLPDDEPEDWFAHGYCTASSLWPGSSPAASSGRGPHAPVPPPMPERRATRRSSAPSATCADASATAASSTWTGDTTEEPGHIS